MPNTMNPEIKALWTAALRSGQYEQGKGQLSKHGKLCCLGVLCELAVEAGVIPVPTTASFVGDVEYGNEANDILLPAEVMEWAGITTNCPEVNTDSLPEGATWESAPDQTGGSPSLANINDGGTPFALIADIIDQQF